jgi:hypothetical protein
VPRRDARGHPPRASAARHDGRRHEPDRGIGAGHQRSPARRGDRSASSPITTRSPACRTAAS